MYKTLSASVIQITEKPISPDSLIKKAKTDASGCVVTYVGLIRRESKGKEVLSAEYEDAEGKAGEKPALITSDAKQRWPLEGVAVAHRIGKLKVGNINLVVAIAAAHRQEGFAACRYVVDQFKQKLPTRKKETYEDGSTWVESQVLPFPLDHVARQPGQCLAVDVVRQEAKVTARYGTVA
jgi:molybdopterin synthase catalytic subunit